MLETEVKTGEAARLADKLGRTISMAIKEYTARADMSDSVNVPLTILTQFLAHSIASGVTMKEIGHEYKVNREAAFNGIEAVIDDLTKILRGQAHQSFAELVDKIDMVDI